MGDGREERSSPLAVSGGCPHEPRRFQKICMTAATTSTPTRKIAPSSGGQLMSRSVDLLMISSSSLSATVQTVAISSTGTLAQVPFASGSKRSLAAMF